MHDYVKWLCNNYIKCDKNVKISKMCILALSVSLYFQESTTETIKYFIKKLSDTYLLPAITATLIALIYFAYKWGRTNLGYKPFTILNILYVEDDTKRK